ncbi:FAD/NAD(P)-binding domain-containing protein [Parathielavia appendiculata]|uniref:FAD/NAD(P)-binding domain-containing protein n=1 Tax=Parathielavia appendiculata TaxID=2587402 RepID=A0AAN6TT70_9PEZI|nr:FAD/NAD(P)-binding domain-containing protein [Parathielavia appendiculata]
MGHSAETTTQKPILIIGAGVSGLLLAQYLRKTGLAPFRIFERDADLTTRGLGWGLTLHWSLPALQSLLPEDLVRRLPEAYVDRLAVEEGRPSTFPFYDLSTGELIAKTPAASESQRIRVTRDRLRRLFATGLDIQWAKAVNNVQTAPDGSVTASFDDGTSCEGSLVVACDGSSSRIRGMLFPDQQRYRIPVRLLGVKIDCTADEIEPLKQLDPYFLQGAASQNDSFMYFSVLDAPGNNRDGNGGKYVCQMVISWPVRGGFFNQATPISFPDTNEGGIELIKTFAETWVEPFRTLARRIPSDTEVKALELYDWPPPTGLRTTGHVALVGDALHPMTMYRGEGANHAIVDVLDLVDLVIPQLLPSGEDSVSSLAVGGLRAALNRYEDRVVARTRPAVLASRQACVDAHQWNRINDKSPLLSRRMMNLDFDESDLSL